MALRNIFLIGIREKCKKFGSGIYSNYAPASRFIENNKFKHNECKTEKNLNYLEDPDTFGTLSGKFKNQSNDDIIDEGDLKEEKYLQNLPLPSQKLTIRQYADLIKQYLTHKRLKEALSVLEIRMLKEDRVKPENYIYNILIGACADVGYTKKAFRLYNDMKRRALIPTGDTYTCLFEACINSPWPEDGLKNAKHLRDHMIEKGIEPNITNYNVMIKAFGRCGDLKTAFKIVDEMISKKIKIRVHTFNHLLHACIADKENGLRYALLVWRKMLTMKEKPNIYSFNLMLKCVKDCNLGSKDDIQSLIMSIQDQTLLCSNKVKRLQIASREANENTSNSIDLEKIANFRTYDPLTHEARDETNYNCIPSKDVHKGVTVLENPNSNLITILPKEFQTTQSDQRTIPNLLSNVLKLNQVLSLQEVHTLQDKFAIIGGQDDFLREMEANAVKPDIKTFTQMLPLIEETREAETKIMDTMKTLNIKPDIDFLNMVIKKRCIRMDYDGAFLIKEFIDNENKSCDKRFRRRKSIKSNIMTYGVLALACKTKENAEKLLNEMKEKHLKVNIEILGALLRHGTVHMKFGYVLFIMDVVKQENLRPNEVFLKHLEAFHDKCVNNIKHHHQIENSDKSFTLACKNFLNKYKTWLKDVHITEIETEHPWKQFMEPQPETVQRQHFEIKEPKKFYKRNRKYIRYTAKV